MRYFQEVTQWDTEYSVPNHIYYMDDGKTKAVGYIPFGKKSLVKFSTPLRIDTKGRKFKVLDLPGEDDSTYFPKEDVSAKPGVVTIEGSGGKKYFLSKVAGKWTCTCPGYMFRRTCKHATEHKE